MMLTIKQKLTLGMLITGLTVPDLLFELLHGTFELVEFSLDQLVEHLFHTDRHTTQIIVFYLLLSMVPFFIFQLSRRLPDWCSACRDNAINTFYYLESKFLDYWTCISFLRKISISLGVLLSFGVMVLVLFR